MVSEQANAAANPAIALGLQSTPPAGRVAELGSLDGIASMEQIEAKPRGFGWRLFVAALLPFVVESAYTFFTRWPSYHFTTASDCAALVASVLIGSAFVLTLPLRLPFRIVSLLFYIPIIGVLLFFYDLLFLAVVFGEGL